MPPDCRRYRPCLAHGGGLLLEERQTEVSSPETKTDGGVPWAGFDTGPSDLSWGASYVGLPGSETEEGRLELDEMQMG